jgi:hypothetical protein
VDFDATGVSASDLAGSFLEHQQLNLQATLRTNPSLDALRCRVLAFTHEICNIHVSISTWLYRRFFHFLGPERAAEETQDWIWLD